MQRNTTFAKKGQVQQEWRLVDADGQVLGRLASKLATILMGKHKPEYTPNVDCGDYLVVINASGIVLTGRKADNKYHVTYSGYPGGQKQVNYGKLRDEKPEEMLRNAVRRMLPKTSLGDDMLNKLKIYAGSEHPHQAQQPEALAV
ncbi:MAG: 50S ribosomal protein L13 [Planctomycetota bacterium]|jgi:large subunit ribosomal protein L13